MKKILLSFMLCLGLMSIPAMANKIESDTSVGVGIAFNGGGTSVLQGGSAIKVPVNLNTIRIEPEFAWGYVDPDQGSSTNSFYLGSGVYLLNDMSNDINLYYGGKVGVRKIEFGGIDDTFFELGGIFGFEYFMQKQVSLGGEIGLLIDIGDDKALGTQTAVTLRYYF